MLKPGCKKGARPKSLISAEAKKSPIQDVQGGQVTKPIIPVKICYELIQEFKTSLASADIKDFDLT